MAPIAAGITALVGWVLMTVKAKFNVEIEAKHREALTLFLQRRLDLVAKGAVKVQGLKVEVGSERWRGGQYCVDMRSRMR